MGLVPWNSSQVSCLILLVGVWRCRHAHDNDWKLGARSHHISHHRLHKTLVSRSVVTKVFAAKFKIPNGVTRQQAVLQVNGAVRHFVTLLWFADCLFGVPMQNPASFITTTFRRGCLAQQRLVQGHCIGSSTVGTTHAMLHKPSQIKAWDIFLNVSPGTSGHFLHTTARFGSMKVYNMSRMIRGSQTRCC